MKKLLPYIFILVLFLTLLSMMSSPSEIVTYTDYVIAPSETLWEIVAHNYDSEVDKREVIAKIREYNNVDGDIYAGQTIKIPVYEEE